MLWLYRRQSCLEEALSVSGANPVNSESKPFGTFNCKFIVEVNGALISMKPSANMELMSSFSFSHILVD